MPTSFSEGDFVHKKFEIEKFLLKTETLTWNVLWEFCSVTTLPFSGRIYTLRKSLVFSYYSGNISYS